MKQKPAQKLVTKPPIKKEAKRNNQKLTLIDTYLGKYPLRITMGLVSLLIIIIFHKFIVGNLYYLFKDIGSDSLNSFYPHLIYINHYLHTDGIPLWSFAQGMGQNVQSISINDPFYLILYLVSPGSLAYAIIWMEIAKMLATSLLMYHFLTQLKLKPVAIIAGTMMYCFSGFMIVGSGWYAFSTEAFCLALLFVSFEKLYQERSWMLFPLAVALLAIVQLFDLYLYGLFLILWILLRHFTSENPSWKRLLRAFLQMAALSLLGLLISSFFSWSSLQVLLDSPRVGGSSGYFNKLMGAPLFALGDNQHNTSAILRFFSNDMLGNGSNYKGWRNYLEAPLFYIGILPLLLMPQIFTMTTKRKAISYAVFLFIMLLPIVFPFFRYALWLFSGDYYRGFSFFVALAFLFLTLYGLNEISGTKKINLYVLAGAFIFLMALLYYPYANRDKLIDEDVQSVARNFLVIYTIIAGLSYFDAFRPYFGITLLLFVFIELGYNNFTNLNERSVVKSREMKQKIGYNDYSVDGVAYINSIDKQFFRVNKNFHSNPAIHTSLNDAQVQGYNGTMVYGSFNQKYYIRFMEEIGVIKKGKELESRWVIGLVNRPLLQNLVSTKYSLVKGRINDFKILGYDSITQFGDVKVLKNKYFLPLGFMYHKYIMMDSFSKASLLKKDIILQQAFVAENPVDPRLAVFKQYSLADTIPLYTFQDYFNDAVNLKKDTLTITQFSQNHIKGRIELDSSGVLFLSIPFDKGWHSIVDGKAIQPMLCNIGFMGLILESGKHNIELDYCPPWYYESLFVSIIALCIFLAISIANYSYNRKKRKLVDEKRS